VVTPLTHKLVRDVGRHKAQFIAVVVTIFLGVTLFAASYDSFQNLKASYENTFTEFRFANLTISGGDTTQIGADAQQTAGVESVQLRTVTDVPIRVGDVKMLGRMVGLPVDGQPQVNQIKVLEGGYLDPERPEAILVEQHMADHFGLRPGDPFEVLDTGRWRAVTVAGVISSPEYLWPAKSRQEIFVAPDDFGVIFGAEELARDLSSAGPNEAVVYYANGDPSDALDANLSAMARTLGATEIYTRAEQPSNAGLSEDLKGFEEWSVFFPVLFLAAAAMAAYVMISRLVYSQRPQIGVMSANGFTRMQILRHYVGYGIWPGLVGAIPGAIVGVLLARVITTMYAGMLSIPVTLVRFYPATLLTGIMFGLVAAVIAALAPALVASRVRPAEAMRGETQGAKGRPSIVERLIPPIRRTPIMWRLPMRGIERNPRRTAYTILGVVLSLVLILVSWGMIDTVQHLLDRQFVAIQRQDATIHFTTPADTPTIVALQDVDGVARAESQLELPISLAAGANHYDTVLYVLQADTEMHGFVSTSGDWIDLPAEGILVGKSVQGLLDVGVGDEIDVTIAPLGQTISVQIAGFVDEPLGTVAYMSHAQAEAITGGPVPATAALIRYAPGTSYTEIRSNLTALDNVAAFQDAKAIYNLAQSFMTLFYAFVGVMLAFGAAMSFALIFNSMSVNIAERRREIATLLAVGMERRSISQLITAENMLVALLGIPLGLVAGYFVAQAAMASFTSDLFSFDLYVKPMTYVWSALAILAVALISQWPGLRAIRNVNIPEIVKERSE
jgi:putative ABC transport system permease protein